MSRYEKKPDGSGYCFSYCFINSSTRSSARIMSAFALLPLISPRFKASKDAIISLYCLFASSSNLSHFILSPLYFNIIRSKKSEKQPPGIEPGAMLQGCYIAFLYPFSLAYFSRFSNVSKTFTVNPTAFVILSIEYPPKSHKQA